MTHKPLDTLEIYKKLISTGIPHPAAEVMCKTHKEMHDGYYSQFVTKAELPWCIFKWVGGTILLFGALAGIVTLFIEHPPFGESEKAVAQPRIIKTSTHHAIPYPSPDNNIIILQPAR